MRLLHVLPVAACVILLAACGDSIRPSNVGPTAAFTVRCVELECTLVNGSRDPDGTIQTYEWSFGDLEGATTRDAIHTYAKPGQFTVSLIVIDDDAWTASASRTLDVKDNPRPTAGFSYACSDLACRFTDQSADTGGWVAAYRWDFGDQSGLDTTRNPMHTYAVAGQYIVRLTVTDNDGASAATSSEVAVHQGSNLLPRAAFTVSCTDFTCAFRDESSDADGTVTARLWDFGDGESTDRNPVHTFTFVGFHTVRLTVTDDRGGTGDRSAQIRVGPPYVPPIAAFSPTCSGVTCTFTNESDHAADSMWDFGDGQTSSEWSPTHVYDVTDPTTFTVTLSVTDYDLGVDSASQTITVTPESSGSPKPVR